MPIRKSSSAVIDALTADLTSESPVTREAAIARLTLIGPRAVESLIALVDGAERGATARMAALRALEALADSRAIEPALRAAHDGDAGVASAAVAVARVFLRGQRGPAVLDWLTLIALDRERPDTVRLAAIAAIGDLPAATREPLWDALGRDRSPAVRARVRKRRPPTSPVAPVAEQLAEVAERGLPNDPEVMRRLLSAAGADVPLPGLHRIIERLREREASLTDTARAEWTRARGSAHVALAKRSSRLALYDMREALEAAKRPLPVEFLAALSMNGDASCLEAIAAAHGQAVDAWWRRHLADTFRAIVSRERLTARHAVMKKIQKRWGALP